MNFTTLRQNISIIYYIHSGYHDGWLVVDVDVVDIRMLEAVMDPDTLDW